MTHITISKPHRCAQPARRPGLLSLISLARQRRALSKLDDAALEDIGITRAEAEAEAARPIWDAPQNWYKQLY